jgi:peptide-methionine (S)-S-oxide reductase
MTIVPRIFAAILSVAAFAACMGRTPTDNNTFMEQEMKPAAGTERTSGGRIDTATFGAGCFWCVEAVFQRLDGVLSVKSGYAGGTTTNPTYKEVCSGSTGHAEVAQITYDPAKISFDELLEVFWKTHDPTTMNRQGNDIGTQYRSVIFYHNEEQRATAEAYKKKLNEEKVYPNPIVTQIVPFTNYYPAENYHQNYYNQNGSESYCRYVIQPKVEKFEKVFKDKLKKH